MKPNVVLVTCHDLGRFLGTYGREVETPEIDELGEEGVVFDNNFATAPQCSPSRGSIMTGKYPHNHGLVGLAHEGYGWELDESEKTLPQYLNEAGYETHLFGLQHESRNPEDLGYKHVHGSGIGEQRAKPTTDEFLCFLEELGDGKDGSPFFASVGFFEPHRPYGLDRYDNEDTDEVSPLPFLPDTREIREDLTGLYGMIYRVDESVGRIRRKLKESELAEDTLLIFTVDHGIAMPRAKGTCYDPGVGIALIVHKPGEFSGGRRCKELTSNVDLLPSILDHLDIEVPEDLDGKSFLPLLKGKDYSERGFLFHEITWHDKYNPIRAIRTNQFKYIRNFVNTPSVYLPADVYDSPSGEATRNEYYRSTRPDEELYDLQEDPLEKENLAEKPELSKTKNRLSGILQSWMQESNDPLLEGPVPPTEEQKKTLEKSDLGN
ncbi:sulfatase [Candidatus Bipolaricaulota bacterium]|nr:sulfatase [Candidatus Bipolaricaulota bacterium]